MKKAKRPAKRVFKRDARLIRGIKAVIKKGDAAIKKGGRATDKARQLYAAAAKLEKVSVTPSLERQHWVERAVEALRVKFGTVGYTIPDEIRVSVGWPKRAASCGAIGECWSASCSSDLHAEVFISPQLADGVKIVGVLAHELAHATVGAGHGHGPVFKRCALAIGLLGPMRSTSPSLEFTAWAEKLFKRIGPYPSGFLTDVPKQGARLLKCECATCGYLVRITRKWISLAGPPICPTDGIHLTEEELEKRKRLERGDLNHGRSLFLGDQAAQATEANS